MRFTFACRVIKPIPGISDALDAESVTVPP
jgi:hypothetical protein